MTLSIDTLLEIRIVDLGIHRNEAVGGMVDAHEKKDEYKFKTCFEDYEKFDELCKIGNLMLKGGLEEWDWKWAAEKGILCEIDWIWFKDDIENGGVDWEEYKKRWDKKSENEIVSEYQIIANASSYVDNEYGKMAERLLHRS